jgi:hypothetical protein
LAASDYVVQGKLGGDVTVSANTNDWIIPFASDFDPQGWWVNAGTGGTNPYTSAARIRPTVAGYYEVSLGALWAPGATTNNQDNVQILKNGQAIVLLQATIPTGVAGLSMGGTKMVYMNGTTDYISFTAFTANTGGQTLSQGNVSGASTWCSAHLIAYGPGYTGFTGPTGDAGAAGTTGFTGPTGADSMVTGPTGPQGPAGPAGEGGGGGGSVSIVGSTGFGSVVSVATGGTGLFGNTNLFFDGTALGIQTTTPVTALDVNGGVTIRNGLRPLYSNVIAASLSSGVYTVPANAYGTHFNITTTAITAITIPTVTGATDSNAYWVFRNNTGGYESITFTYTTAGTTFPANPVAIPPANSVVLMVTFPSSVLGYVLF